jgi:hypothetical protein
MLWKTVEKTKVDSIRKQRIRQFAVSIQLANGDREE